MPLWITSHRAPVPMQDDWQRPGTKPGLIADSYERLADLDFELGQCLLSRRNA